MHRGVPAELAEADVIALNTDGEIRAARGATAAGQPMIAFSGGVIDTDTLYHENMHQWWGDNASEGGYRFPASRSRSQRIGGNDAGEVAPGTAGHGPATRSIYVFFLPNGLGIRPGHVPADLRRRGGRMYREGRKQKEIRVAIDGPSGAYDDDPEQAGDSKPEKDHGHGSQQPAEMRSRAEYYEELRAADMQMAASDGRSDRPPLDSLHVTPERAGHILDGDRWGGGHRHGTGKPWKTEFPASWDDEKIIGHVLSVARAPDDPPVFQANRRWRVHGSRQ